MEVKNDSKTVDQNTELINSTICETEGVKTLATNMRNEPINSSISEQVEKKGNEVDDQIKINPSINVPCENEIENMEIAENDTNKRIIPPIIPEQLIIPFNPDAEDVISEVFRLVENVNKQLFLSERNLDPKSNLSIISKHIELYLASVDYIKQHPNHDPNKSD